MDEEILINLQGDEPLMHPSVVDAVAAPLLAEPGVLMSTAALRQVDPWEVRARLRGQSGGRRPGRRALLLPVPGSALSGYGNGTVPEAPRDLRIPAGFLLRVAALPPSPLEEAERLEQLRVLQAGYRIRVVDVADDSVGVDTPEDLKVVEERVCGPKRR